MALVYIELADGKVRDVNSVEQMYQLDVGYPDKDTTRVQYWDWATASTEYRKALAEPMTRFVTLGVYKFECALEGEDFKELD